MTIYEEAFYLKMHPHNNNKIGRLSEDENKC